jgi:2-haloalkanoic acid dehalogenase type II
MTKALTDFSVLTFDCYGTLIDWETGIWDALQPLLMENGSDAVNRKEALEAFGAEENEQEARTPALPYPQVLARVHRAVAKRFGLLTREDLDSAFAASLPHWPAFPDTAEALRALQRRYRLVILSNVHREGFAASNRKLGVRFDAVYTAEDIGSYKPSPRNFEFLLERLKTDLGVSPDQVLHTAQSLFHDHVPARVFGLANCWIDRQGLSRGGEWGATAKVREKPEVDFLFASLGDLAAAIELGADR